MTISGTGKASSNRQGLTLLEIIVCLGIIGIIVSFFVLQFSEAVEEEVLRKPATELRKYTQTALRSATAYREEYRITFLKNEFILSQGALIEGFQQDRDVFNRFRLPKGVEMTLKRLGSKEWAPAEGVPWVFQPAGFCEPLEVRFSQGEAWIELEFHPMTGRVVEERYFFP